MKLLVVRHAVAMDRAEYQNSFVKDALLEAVQGTVKAVAASSTLHNDEFRPLTLEGLRKMKRQAKDLRELVKKPKLVLTSPLTRAQQTTDILIQVAWPDVPVETCMQLKPESRPEEFLAWYRERAELPRSNQLLALVGHEPHLSTLVSYLLAGATKPFLKIKKGGACLLEFDGIPRKGKGKLLALWGRMPSA